MRSFIDKNFSRRQFMDRSSRLAGLAMLGSAFVGQTPAADPGRKLGVALLGLGSLSKNQIAPALQKTRYCQLTGLISGTPQKLKDWSAQYKIPEKNLYNYQNLEKIAENPDIDVVYVVTPNALHAEYTIRAAKAGKHVLCEKPMEVSVKKCEEMIAACKTAKKQLAIGYRCQFVPHHLEMMRLAREKTFGEVKLIEASFGFRIGDPTQWRLKHALAGGGALMDVGVYALQGARYVAGTEPIEVAAYETKTDQQKFREVDESIFWSMKFPGGVMANCGTSYLVGGMNRLWAGADRGFFELTSAYGYSGQEGRTSRGPMNLPIVDHFAAEMDDFAQCILQDRPTKVPGEEGLRDVKIMLAIYESIAKGGKTVQL